MVGITGYSVYIPRHRLPRAVIAAAWGGRAVPGCKAVRHFDEDSLTMGQAALWRLLECGAAPEALYFASTTAPHWQRSSASMIAAACGLPAEVATADFGGSLRCGATALAAAFNAVAAGARRQMAVVASDSRDGAPESAEEITFGDAAASIAVGSEGVIAELVSRASRSDDFLDEWRRDTDDTVTSLASKFSTTRGYQANVVEAARGALQQAGVDPKQVTRAALASPDGQSHAGAAKALGIPPERVEDSRLGDIGVTGAAMPLLLLAQALDRAQPGDWILAAAYGDGANAFLFRATDRIAELPRPLVAPDPAPLECRSYAVYRKLRHFLRDHAGGPEMSNVLWEREEPQNVRLRGTFCPRCGRLQFPQTRVCGGCRSTEGLVEKPLARAGRLFTFTKDYLYDAPAQPTIMAVVDLDGGGRFLCQMTDAAPDRVGIGMEIELVLRRMREGPSMHHYYWKCRPAGAPGVTP